MIRSIPSNKMVVCMQHNNDTKSKKISKVKDSLVDLQRKRKTRFVNFLTNSKKFIQEDIQELDSIAKQFFQKEEEENDASVIENIKEYNDDDFFE
jgi:regulator of extracellular matrix RemA (YlzA/DUF370 family)